MINPFAQPTKEGGKDLSVIEIRNIEYGIRNKKVFSLAE